MPNRSQSTYGRLFLNLLDQGIKDACLHFKVGGQDFIVGDKKKSNQKVLIYVKHPRFFSQTLAYGSLGMGESFMLRDFEIENEQLPLFLEILLRNRLDQTIKITPIAAAKILFTRLTHAVRKNTLNIRSHYDAGDDLFKSFLDNTMTYTCGYAKHEDDSLEELQQNKLHRICQKLKIQKDDRILDLGCGWGGLLIHAAKNYGAQGTGVTMSENQYRYARDLIKTEELSNKLDIVLDDFGNVDGMFDKIVSVGIMEHLPRNRYQDFFQKIARSLKPGGIGLIHCIGSNAPKNMHDPFFQKYIFPNSNQPHLSEISRGLEKYGLPILDVENMARHYGHTTRRWLENFRANRDGLDPKRYDDRFKRMWEFYLSAGIAASSFSSGALYQVLFNNDYTAPIPLHRI